MKISQPLSLLAVVMGVAFTVSQSAMAQTYDAVADFSLAANQNVAGVWSYGQTTTRGGAFSLLTTAEQNFSGFTTVDAWRGSAGGFQGTFPLIARNKTATTASYFTIVQPTDLLNLHPGPSGENSVLRWIAPAAGTYRIQGRFQGLDTQSTTTDEAILLNSLTTLFVGNINVSGGGNVATFDITRTLSAGDRVDFSVGFGNGSYGNDSTGLAATIRPSGSAAPEPSALALIAFAALPLVRYHRRARFSKGN